MLYQNMSLIDETTLNDNYMKAAIEGNMDDLIECINKGIPIDIQNKTWI
jgi:hypothetical protein